MNDRALFTGARVGADSAPLSARPRPRPHGLSSQAAPLPRRSSSRGIAASSRAGRRRRFPGDRDISVLSPEDSRSRGHGCQQQNEQVHFCMCVST
jgi:hypothetical protein